MAGPTMFRRRKTAVLAAVSAMMIAGTVLADEKKKEPAPRPTPSHPAAERRTERPAAPVQHTPPPQQPRQQEHSNAGSGRPVTPDSRPTPSNRGEFDRPTRFPNSNAGTPQPPRDRNNNTGIDVPRAPRDYSTGGRTGSANPQPNRTYQGSTNRPYNPTAGRTTQRAGQDVVVRSNGHPSEIHSRDMMIRRGPQGTAIRRTVVEREGRVYSFNRAGYGHVRTSYSYGNREYVVRRYYVGGASFPRYYRPYAYRGVYFDAYAPGVYYSPYYYGWAYRPWVAPIVFSWGWGRSPWYGYYGGYFTPYQSYPSANLWLTDYVVAQTLESGYRERVESARAAQMDVYDRPQQYAALTPDIKQQISEEVQRQLSYEAAEAQRFQGQQQGQQQAPPDPGYTGVGRMIEDNRSHVLLSNANIDVTTLDGKECSITQGDAIAVNPGQGAGAQGETIHVQVLASAGGGCPANSVVTISLQDLQEMVNHVRATIDSGLAAMQKDPNLPKPPANVPTAAIQSDFTGAAPPADPNEAAELQRLNQEATATEKSVVSETSYVEPPRATAAPQDYPIQQTETRTTDLQLGMAPEEVVQVLGRPTSNVKAGSKQIMTYQALNLKLVFSNGKLSDIQ